MIEIKDRAYDALEKLIDGQDPQSLRIKYLGYG